MLETIIRMEITTKVEDISRMEVTTKMVLIIKMEEILKVETETQIKVSNRHNKIINKDNNQIIVQNNIKICKIREGGDAEEEEEGGEEGDNNLLVVMNKNFKDNMKIEIVNLMKQKILIAHKIHKTEIKSKSNHQI